MKTRLLWCVCLCSLVTALASADLAERSIFVGGSARLLGLGGAGVAGPEDGTSLFWNPALLGIASQTEFGFTDAPLQSRAVDREGFLSVLLNTPHLESPLNRASLGMATWFDGWGKDPEKNRIIRTGIGVPIGHGVALGANLVHERRNTDLGVDVGWALDLGVVWNRHLNSMGHQIRAGMVAQRLVGKRNWINVPDISTPLHLGWGIGYQPDRDSWLVADLGYTADDAIVSAERLRLNLGLERWLFDRVALRVGYSSVAHYDHITDGEWARGFGLRTDKAELNYAYVSGGALEHGVHWISATVRWAWRPEEPVAAAPQEEPILPVEKPGVKKASVAITPPVFSPNGDGRQDVVNFRVEISPMHPWLIRIRDANGQSVRTLSAIKPHWNGLDSSSALVPDGTYHAIVTSATTDEEWTNEPFIVDTTPPVISLTTEPLVLMSQKSQASVVIEVPKVHVQVQDGNALGRWALAITDMAGRALTDFSGDGIPPGTILWKEAETKWSPETANQSFQCMIQVEDIAGNIASEMSDLTVVDLAQIGSRREKRGIVMTLPGIAFETNSSEIRTESSEALSEAAQAIRAYPDAKVRIEGHTDDRGSEGYNMNLSLARANAVMDYLIENLELDPMRFSTVGYGESQPVADNSEEEGRQQNRRVEIVLLLSGEEEVSVSAATEPPATTPSEQPSMDGSETPEAQAPPQSKAKYTVSVGSFKNRENAEMLLEVIQQIELSHEIRLLKVPMGDNYLYRVTVGAFENEAPAEKLAGMLENEHGLLPVVMPYQ